MDELDAATAGGHLAESAHLELKATITNDKLARSIASLAINGGTLLIGVTDDATLRPIRLDGWTEKVAQVAWMRPDPGLSPRVWTIPSREDPTEGVVVVAVDASPLTPHMVDDRYPARLGTTTGYLSDADVARLMERRKNAQRTAGDELAAYLDRDPLAAADGAIARSNDYNAGRYFLVLVPRLADQEMLLTAMGNPKSRHTWILNELIEPLRTNSGIQSWPAPNIPEHYSQFSTRGDGMAMTNYLSANRSPERYPRKVAELELTDNGTLRLFAARASDELRQIEYLMPAVIMGLTMQALHLAARISEITSYRGPWACGLALTGIGERPAHWSNSGFADFPYPEDTYTQLTTATSGELQAPHRIGWRLVGPFLRAIRAADRSDLRQWGLLPLDEA